MPKWTYIFYIILFSLAFKRCFKSNLHILRIMVFPMIFAILAWWNFNLASDIYKHGLWIWLVGGLIGFTEGLISTKKLGLRADKKRWYVEMPGSWLILVLTVLLFGLECAIYYIEHANIPALKAKIFIITAVLASGWTAGMIIGRHINYLYKFFKAGHTDLG
ncbi:MAG: hypothetical protein K0S11_1374 [Gammaproteobacteria bacterium]|nr:hypothetical protein [Gammaproteobacteria bacterium]